MTVRGGFKDGSGSIAVAATAQDVFSANSGRNYLLIQNVSTADLWVNYGVTAVADQPSIKLEAGASIVFECGFIPTGRVSITGATLGQKFVAKEG